MHTAIIINLDYENQPIGKCSPLWSLIEARMTGAGFVKKNRRFVTSEKLDTACKQAQAVIDSIEAEYAAKGRSAMTCIRDFYAVPAESIVDLVRPVAHAIEVDMMSTGAFQKYFS